MNEYAFMDYFSSNVFAEYIYLFKDGQWFVSELNFVDNPKITIVIALHTIQSSFLYLRP